MRVHLRASEWVLVGFFGYVAFISLFFPDRPHLGVIPFCVFLFVDAVLAFIDGFERGRWRVFVSHLRDWLPLLYTFVAFREMELFLPRTFEGRLEAHWIALDRLLLEHYQLRAAIESLGVVIPLYLELCYLFVYAIAAICVGILYERGKRAAIDRFWIVVLTGTLLAYALFPFFPSQPPRYVFPGLDKPSVITWARRFNLFILNKATIHVGVFPSAHVSAAFSCAWAMFALIPQRKIIGCALVLYACSVSLATVYGRYHYAADVVAGFAVSLIAAVIAAVLSKNKPEHSKTSP